ncbi:hypothetical protein VB714_24280 [Spirulina sp. 06S082]|nr:hypothetical protein [Spirulina sp. 06S082]
MLSYNAGKNAIANKMPPIRLIYANFSEYSHNIGHLSRQNRQNVKLRFHAN